MAFSVLSRIRSSTLPMVSPLVSLTSVPITREARMAVVWRSADGWHFETPLAGGYPAGRTIPSSGFLLHLRRPLPRAAGDPPAITDTGAGITTVQSRLDFPPRRAT